MRKLIHKFHSQRKIVKFAAILIVFGVAAGTVTITGIDKNVKEMSAPIEPTTPYFPEYPIINYTGKTPQEIDKIKRGEYLTKAGDCIACHTNTPAKGPIFAGGLPMQTPFGTIFSPNITPDKKTGIGNWTEAQFINAMREGISPHGARYYPAFPYLYFNKVTTEDLQAIKAYLDNIPVVVQQNRKNEMVWPFNFRFLQSGWRALFFNPQKTGPFKPDPSKSTAWNRGAYLVEGLGHCAMCHTPSYHIISEKLSLGAPIRKYSLTGAKIQGYLAPNITKSNLGAVSDEEIAAVFTHNRLIGGGNVEGPMLEANQDSLRHLTQSDRLAIATYLKSVQSKIPPKPKADKANPGKPIYENYCSGCHANGAGGAPRYGDVLTWDPIIKTGKDKIYTNAIKGINGMPAKGTCISCTDTEIKEAVDYMIVSVTGKAGQKITPPAKKLTIADGKRIYMEDCSVCHETGFKNAPKPGDVNAWKQIVRDGFLAAYQNVLTGQNGHPPRGACVNCSDAELIAAIKYMLQQSAPNEDYSLW